MTLSSYIQHVFGPEATEYIGTELSRFSKYDGGLRRMLGSLPIEAGRTFAFVPAPPPKGLIATEGAEVLRHSLLFYSGGSENVSREYRDAEAGFIAGWLKGAPRRLALFQTEYFRFEQEPYRLAPGERLFVCKVREGDARDTLEGWVFIDAQQSSREDIELARARGMSPYPPTIGLLTCLPSGRSAIQSREVMSPTNLEELVEQAAYLIIGAFDYEVLLFWERPPH